MYSRSIEKKNIITKKSFFILFIAILAFSSCTTYKGFTTFENVNVGFDAYASKENTYSKKVAMLVCNLENIPKSDLKNLELEDYIKKTLTPKGYNFTSKKEEANMVISYEYGVSEPKVYTIPIGQKVVKSNGIFGGGVVTETVTKTITKYLCWLNIKAFDTDYYRKTGEDKMLWHIEIQSENETDNLRYIFPYMLTAASEYIGQSHSNRITVNVPSNPVDKRVMELKGTLVKVITNQSTTGKKDPKITIYEDVYKDGNLLIKAGTPVELNVKKGKGAHFNLNNFSTISFYNNNIWLKGNYQFNGEYTKAYTAAIIMLCIPGPNALFPVWIPLLAAGKKRAKLPEGTLLYLEIE